MSARHGKDDGKALVVCVILLVLSVLMLGDLAKAEGYKSGMSYEYIPVPKHKPTPLSIMSSDKDLLVSAILDTNALHVPVKRSKIKTPTLD